MTTSQADLTVCCSPGSPPEISENVLVICVVALGGGAQSPLHRFSRDALLMESDGDQGPRPYNTPRPDQNIYKQRPDGDSWAVAKAAADRDVCVVQGMQLNFNFQKTGAQAEIVWLFIFQSLLVVPYRTIE